MRDAVWVGLAQALALIPGTSRSGATITAGLFLGLKREAAARFSFLLSVPAIVLSGLFGLVEIFTGEDDVSVGALAVSTIFAFIFGYISIAFLLRFLANHSTLVFVIYRVVLGGAGDRPDRERHDQLTGISPASRRPRTRGRGRPARARAGPARTGGRSRRAGRRRGTTVAPRAALAGPTSP